MDAHLYTLGINAASEGFGVALAGPDGLLAETVMKSGMQHSERLLPEIQHLMASSGLAVDALGAIAVTIGPGSFTSIRIGLSTAKGLCLALGIPLVPVSSLLATAAQLPFAEYPVVTWLDAKRRQIYAATFDTSQGTLEPRQLGAETVAEPREWLDRCSGPHLFAGSGAAVYRDLIIGVLGSDAHFAPPLVDEASAASVALIGSAKARAGDTSDPDSVNPTYLRRPDAVRPQPTKGSAR